MFQRYFLQTVSVIPLIMIVCLLQAFQPARPQFRVLALAEGGGHHIAYTKAARGWLDKLAADSHFTIDYIDNTDRIDSVFLSQYQLFIQLDYPPYAWKAPAVKAFEQYVNEGRGGWIGFHHATLLGEFDGYGLWPWFYAFMGQIRFKDYIAGFAAGNVHVEDAGHPVLAGVPAIFNVKTEEWYTYDKSPRPHVHVLANVDERSYQPASTKTMGDHPVIWTNPDYKARNVYIFMGHSPDLFENIAYLTIFKNAIFWASGQK